MSGQKFKRGDFVLLDEEYLGRVTKDSAICQSGAWVTGPTKLDTYEESEFEDYISKDRLKHTEITWERCPHCESEVPLATCRMVHECPECGSRILSCSVCVKKECNICVYD